MAKKKTNSTPPAAPEAEAKNAGEGKKGTKGAKPTDILLTQDQVIEGVAFSKGDVLGEMDGDKIVSHFRHKQIDPGHLNARLALGVCSVRRDLSD